MVLSDPVKGLCMIESAEFYPRLQQQSHYLIRNFVEGVLGAELLWPEFDGERSDVLSQIIQGPKLFFFPSFIRIVTDLVVNCILWQTAVEGFQNLHGVREGCAWIARFLNVLPTNLYTAAALQDFLEMAGFALHKRYKTQFRKMLDIIAKDFLTALKDRGDAKLNKVIVNIRNYIESNQFLKEPEGGSLMSNLESHNFTPESAPQQQYGYQQNRYYC
nr:protein GLE1-like [Nicotiana tomentosiformis]